MNIQARKETESVNEQGGIERRVVETTDYRSSAGQAQELRTVEVIHQSHPNTNPNTSGGLLAEAAAAVESTLQSAKEAISGK
ncbi:hypothetical protein LWI29_005612 [Acer saccharum]|uniref:Uncharacterized protein n=2 Tax=Acer TaxID=4022 RepID=A0A5C7HQS8_9ROSI|nr:hypothetical protein LWI29_005612 [Acer saccharum]KAK1587742.1 hypothetical protein Q3G72_016409 [Acer saccharum]TXG59370.1 hypothetical protein EZV62_013943 [Acer yangbiense]